jgi:glycosyltransferase involved in cell wall biosynthesis
MSSIVSVIIATYNSALFVVETLESVSHQTWKDIELIITDDCSIDDTIDVCRDWINKNSQRFVRTEILTTDKNTGVSANANRGLHIAKGDWIKLLGADDTLKPGCVNDNMLWIASHPEAKVLFSQIEIYRDKFRPENLIETVPGDPHNPDSIFAASKNAVSQYRMLLVSDRIHFSPGVFLNREVLFSVGCFDERFKLLEDYPMWINLTRNGHRLFFMEKVTVNYRRHSKAINNTRIDYIIKPNYFRTEGFRKMYTYPNLPVSIKLNQRYNWYVSQIFRINRLNRNIKGNRFLLTLLTVYMNPFRYYIYLIKRLNKNLEVNEFYN